MQVLFPEIQHREEVQCLNILNDLCSLESVIPDARVNALFENFFQLISRRDMKVEDQELINFWSEKLSKICARAEGELEKYWIEYFLDKSELNWFDLEEFVYFENYLQLVEWEFKEYKKFTGQNLQSCLLVGSGSMPLTALILAKKYGVKVNCLDIDDKVVESSMVLIERLGLSHLVSVKRGDFWMEKNLGKGLDLVLVGALIGGNQMEKNLVVEKLGSLEARQNFLMRYGQGWGSLAYLDFDKSKLSSFDRFVLLRPEGTIINSILIGKK